MSGVLAGLLCALTWAIGSISPKELSQKLDPLTLNAPRSLIAGLFALVVTLSTGRAQAYQAITLDKLAFLLASVWIGGGLGDSAYIMSMARIGVSRAFPISSTYPVLTLLFSILFLSEQPTWGMASGLALVLLGILFLSRTHDDTPVTPATARGGGVILAVLASVCCAASNVLVAPGARGLDPIMVASIRVPAISLVAWGAVAMRRTWPQLRALTRREWLYILIGGLIGWGMGSMLFVYSVSAIGPARAAILTSTAPLFALPLSALVLKEKPTRATLFGSLLAVSGVALVSF